MQFDPADVAAYLEDTYDDNIFVISFDMTETFVEIPEDLVDEIAEDLLSRGAVAVDVVTMVDYEPADFHVTIGIIS